MYWKIKPAEAANSDWRNEFLMTSDELVIGQELHWNKQLQTVLVAHKLENTGQKIAHSTTGKPKYFFRF